MKMPGVEITPTRVDAAIELFIQHKTAEDSAANTLKRYGTDLKRLSRVAGNIYVHQVSSDHIDRMMNEHTLANNGQGARNNTITNLRQFFIWAQRTKRMSPWEFDNPMGDRKRKAYEVEQPPSIPHEHFPVLLDMAEEDHPLHRAYFALGLYTAARGPSELGPLRLWDIVTTGSDWSVSIKRIKTLRSAEPVPMVNELSTEIVKWLTWYNQWTMENLGAPLQREWYLLPCVRSVKGLGTATSKDKYGRNIRRVYPWSRRHPAGFARITRPVLEKYGYPVTDENGKPNGWGGTHILRKSGARAFYKELLDSGLTRDRALDVVKDLLGHKNVAMTEHYLGLDRGREFRDELMRGRFMFRSNDPAHQEEDGATRLRPLESGQDSAESAVNALPDWLRRTA